MAQNDSMVSGDSMPLDFPLTDYVTGAAADLSTVTAIVYKMATSPTATTADVTKTLGAGITVSGNTVTVTLAPADTASLAGVYFHELQVTGAGGTVETPIQGYLSIERDLIQ